MEREMMIMILEVEICVEECLMFDDVGSSSKRHYGICH
jgi:hypothetical protein